MNIILPPGSTSADLHAAINNAALGDTIIISGDMPFAGTVTIQEDKEITIGSDTGNNWVMSAPGSNIRHFTVRGNLTLQNITLDGGTIGGGLAIIGGSLTMNEGAVIQNCRSNVSGGGINASNSNITVNEGAIIQNCYSSGQGGGAYVNPNGTITVNGGVIRENTAAAAGGGIYFQECTFMMTGGEFIGNTASASGGAIQMLGSNTVSISDSIISGNTSGFQGGGIGIPVNTSASLLDVIITENKAVSNGGGAYIQGTVTMSGVTVSGNTANIRGGGLYILAGGKTEITGESYITKNNAPNGGGIYTVSASYNNLITDNETVFHCNWASAAYQPPPDAGTLYPDIQFADTSITDHPLNNFDINYAIGEPIAVYFNVIYDANGGTGSYTGPDIIPGTADTVLPAEDTGISRPDFTFRGWNTEPDGSGTQYAPGDTVTVTCDATLYAQWTAEPVSLTVTYSSNGGSGGYIDLNRQYGTLYTILSASKAGIGRPGFTFTGWNTEPDGSGISFAPGYIITITGDMRLYAQWRQNPTAKPKRICPKPVTKCRTAIEGQKIWVDDGNISNTRPDTVEILLLRDGEVYKRTNVDSENNWVFGFCCLPAGKNSSHKYNYQIDETAVPSYTKTIEGYNVINTLTP